MKKFNYLALILLVVFSACTLPSEIQILGSPQLKLTTSINLNEELFKRIKDGFDAGDGIKVTMLDCPANADSQTYLIHMMVEKHVVLREVMKEAEYNRIKNISLIKFIEPDHLFNFDALGENPIILPFADLGDLLKDIKFNQEELIAKLYLYFDDPFVKDLYIVMEFVEVDNDGNEINPGYPLKRLAIPESIPAELESRKSDIYLDSGVYEETTFPYWGVNIDDFANLLNGKNDIKVNIEVYIQSDVIVEPYKIRDEFNFSAEILLFLPFKFDVTEGAELTIGSFDEVGDFANRIADTLASFSISVKTTRQSPFKDSILNIRQPGTDFRIVNPLGAQSFNFAVSRADMNKIKSLGRNFNPEISIRFPREQTLIFPRNLGITTISLNAEINYKLNL